MPGGRPRLPGTEEERAERRRERVLKNVHQFRARQRSARARKNETSLLPTPSLQTELSTDSVSTSNDDASVTKEIQTFQPSQESEDEAAYLLWLSVRFPYQLHFGPTYRDAFISKYIRSCLTGEKCAQETYVRGFLPVNICCGSWLSSTFSSSGPESKEKRLLSDLLLASALKEFGETSSNTAIKSYALQTHDRVTQALGQHIAEYQSGLKEEHEDPHLLASCILAFAMAELIVHRSWPRFLVHLRGAGAVMQSAGPEQLSSPAARRHFHGFRNLELAFSLMYRERTFPCDEVWLGLPNIAPYSLLEPHLSRLVDISYRIPPELALFDETNAEDSDSSREQLVRVEDIRTRLVKWRISLCEQDPWIPQSTSDTMSYKIDFPIGPASNLLVAYCGASIIASNLVAHVASRFDATAAEEYVRELHEWIQKALDTLRTFLTELPWAIGKMNCLSTLDAAWAVSVERGLEAYAQVCAELARQFEDRGLPVLRKH